MIEVVKQKWASAFCNGDFYLVATCSGYRRSKRDPLGKEYLLPPAVSSEELGIALLDSLAHSRFLSLDELDDFFDLTKGREAYELWVQSLLARQGYKSRRAFFKKMAHCDIDFVGDTLKITPTHHEKLEGWGREKDDGIEDIHLSVHSSNAEIGEALKLAFSRCT